MKTTGSTWICPASNYITDNDDGQTKKPRSHEHWMRTFALDHQGSETHLQYKP